SLLLYWSILLSYRKGLFADILIPQFRLAADEVFHHVFTSMVVSYYYRYAPLLQQFFFAQKCFIFANHHFGYAVQKYSTRTHSAGRQCCVEHTLLIDFGW